jgi:hypothetical protein
MKAFVRFFVNVVCLCLLGAVAQAQLSGTKTIPGDYATITAAVADLNTQGVGSGGVTFNVAAGYTETIAATISLTATGTLANPIVFQKSGGGANPIITAYTGGVGTPATAIQDGIWRLVGSDYVTIDGIDLLENPANTTNPSTMEYGYALYKASATDGCQNVTIRNCTITLNRVNNAAGSGPAVDGSRGIDMVNAIPTAATTVLTVTDAAGSHSNNKFYSNTIQNCNIGIALIGFAAVSPFTLADQNNDVGGASLATGNTIRNFGGGGTTSPAAGIRTLAQYGVNISYNTINNNDGGGINHGTTLRGVFNNTATSASATINNNTITLKGAGTTTAWTGIENAAGSTAAGNTITINNNTVTGDYLTATSGLLYGIFNSATAATVNMENNTVSNINYSASGLAGSGVVYGLYNSVAATNVNFLGNTVNNIARTGTTGGTTIGIYAAAGTNETVKFNTVHSLSIDGTGATSTMYGIQTSTGTIVVDSNVVRDLSVIKTTGTSALYGIYNISSPTNENYNYNQVYNLSHAGTGTTYGIYTFTTTGTRTVSNNLVHSISTGGTTVAGINQSSSSPNIFKNKIYNIQSNSTGAPTVAGIGVASVGTAGAVNIFNNLIGDLKAPSASSSAATAPSVRGINITVTTASSTVDVSYNTVHVNASSGGANFATTALFVTSSATATTAALTLRNNIFVNLSTPAGTGNAVAFQRSSTALDNYTSGSNNNLFYAGTPGAVNLIFFDGTNSDQTVGAFKTRVSPREGASVTENPTFISTSGSSPGFLHVSDVVPTQIESGAQPVVGITDDYDGDVRNASSPDIGADEFNGIGVDQSPPSIVYSPLANTHLTSNRVLGTTISDPSGVQRSPAGSPRLWYKKGAAGAYQETTAVALGDDFTFAINHALLGGVTLGDTVFYYVAAQDSLDNAGTNPAGTSPTINPPNATVASPNFYRIVPSFSGSYTVGTSGTYATLKDFFDSLVDGVVTGNVTASVISDITESATASLTPFAVYPEDSSFTLTIAPSGGARTITGSFASLLELDGADRVIVNGDSGGVGGLAVRNLTLRNTSTTGAVIRFVNDATYNTITNCILESGITSTTSGVIAFSTSVGGSTGNSNNTISNNIIRDRSDDVGVPANLIYSSGTAAAPNAGNMIVNNEMFNFTVNAVNFTATGAGNGWTIDSNMVYQTASRTTALGGFRVLGGSGHVVRNNSIGGSAVDRSGAPITTSSTFSGIVMTVGTADTSVVQGNRLSNIDATAATSVGISVTSGNVNVLDNVVGGGQAAHDTIVVRNTADMITTSSAGTVNIHNNVVGNIRHQVTTSIRFAGISATNGIVSIKDNIVRDIWSNSIGTTTTLIPSGMYLTAIDNPSNIEGNQIYNMHLEPTGTGGYTIVGMYVDEGTGTSGTTRVHRNRIYAITNAATGSGATGPRVVGISPRTGSVTYYNNMISLGEGTSGAIRVYGIEDLTTTAYTSKYYYNSVLISGTQTGDNSSFAFRRAGTTVGPDTLRNNIFANVRSGGAEAHFAIGNTLATNWGPGTSDNNLFFTSDQNNMGQWLTSGGDLPTWRSLSTSDSSSHFGNPQYVSTTNLHILTGAGSPADSAATPIAGITMDFDGDLRDPNFPDIGADEFIFVPPDRDLRMTIVLPPPSPILAGDSVEFRAIVDNLSQTIAETTYTINWFVGELAQPPIQAGPIGTGASDTVSLPWTAVFGQHTITSIVSVAGDLNHGNDTARVTVNVSSVFSGGTYTVGTTSGTFPTLKSAFDSLNVSAVTGNVVLSILNEGTIESATAELNEIVSSGGGPYSITIKPASGATPTILTNLFGFNIKFNGTDNVTIDGSNSAGGTSRDLTIMNITQTTNSGAIWVASLGTNAGAENITIKNCNLIAGRADTNNTFGIFAAGQAITSTGTGAHNNNLVIENNSFTRARFAVYSRGVATTGIQTGLVIQNNVMGSDSAGHEISYRAIDLGNTDGAIINGNRIFNMIQPLGFSVTGVHLDVNVSNAMISNNVMRKLHQTNTGTFGAIGININSATGSTNNLIVNNMISDMRNDGGGTSTVSNPFGIRIAGGTNHKVYYNSVSLSESFFNAAATDISAAFIVTSTTATGLDVRNNVFANTMTGISGTRCYAIYVSVASFSFGTIDRNDYYVAGANGVLGRQSTTDIPTLAGWRTYTGQDLNSVSADPQFIDAVANLHINTAQATPVESRGVAITGIPIDIDGETRHAITPDIGADEGVFIPHTLAMVAATFDSTSARVNLSWGAPPALRVVPEDVKRAVVEDGAETVQSPVLSPRTLEDFESMMITRFVSRQAEARVSTAVQSRATAHVAVEDVVDRVSETMERIEDTFVDRVASNPQRTGDSPEAVLTGYRIYKALTGGSFSLLDSVDANATAYVDSVVQARSYSYYLVAVFDNGTSEPSATVEVSVPFIRAEVEPNNTAATANYMTLGYQVEANINPGGDIDVYRFTSAPGHLIVDASNLPANDQTDVYVVLYDSTGSTALYEIDRNYNERLEFNLPYSGRYFVEIGGYDGTVVGPYTLYARIGTGTDPYEPDDGPLSRSFGGPDYDNISTLFDIATPYSNDTTATLDPGVGRGMGFAFDVDYYRFVGTAGDSIRVAVKTASVGSTILHARVGIGRLDQPTSFRPGYFSGHTNLATSVVTNGADMVFGLRLSANQTYLVYVMNHPSFGDAQTGTGARYLLQVVRVPTGVDEEPLLPTVYALNQNYPNPFNPTTQISYALPKESFVTLRVYNTLGQEVVTLVNEEQKAGYIMATWDGRNNLGYTVGSGLYFYRIEARPMDGSNVFTEVKKMMLVK